MATNARPLRKDAERNRQRILEAARELFAQHGLGVTLNDIAHHAGVGVGTVYRRYPDKQQLIDELFEQQLGELAALMEVAIEDPDPWHGLSEFIERALELQAADQGFKQLLFGAPAGLDGLKRLRMRMDPLARKLLARAQEAGQLRADIEPQDMPILQLMLGTVIDTAREVEPDLWRRYLPLLLQGLRADPGPPEPLAPGPPPPQRMQRVLGAWRPPRR